MQKKQGNLAKRARALPRLVELVYTVGLAELGWAALGCAGLGELTGTDRAKTEFLSKR